MQKLNKDRKRGPRSFKEKMKSTITTKVNSTALPLPSLSSLCHPRLTWYKAGPRVVYDLSLEKRTRKMKIHTTISISKGKIQIRIYSANHLPI